MKYICPDLQHTFDISTSNSSNNIVRAFDLIKDYRDGGRGLYFDHKLKQFMLNKQNINKEYV